MDNRTATRATPETNSVREACFGALGDEELVERYLSDGDERAFVVLMQRHAPRIRRLLYGLLNGNREDIQDVEQEIFVSLWLDLSSFRADSSITTYLFRFTRNKAVDFIRKQARQRRVAEAIGERCASPAEVHAERNRRLDGESAAASLLARLAPEERLLITLKELEGLQIREISELLSVAEGTVKSRLHRIRRKIAAMEGGPPK